MDHPNIAQVLDAGATDKGRPFVVMELVKGVPITSYCDEAQLGTRERLALFGDVCSAIQHAHQKGIIHRDIKPSNVMVTLHGDKPVVKVIDFGIAKATQGKLTDKTLFTRFEQFIGTPVYMSPEQASLSGLDVDTRSDIYALGILLYELLTGKPPFDAKTLASAGYEEMRRIIREVEPPKPSSRLSTMSGEERTLFAKARHIELGKFRRLVEPDLDWIVMKAIDKDRARRYETANGLATDIRRFLADEPVSATPPSAGYLLRKFARRNKRTLRVAAGIAVMLVAATLVSTWQAVRATRAEKNTADSLVQVAAERDAKELARKEAKASEARALEAEWKATANAAAERTAREDAEAISKFLGEVFQSPDPTHNGRIITVAELLDTAARKLDTDLASQPDRRAKLRETLGRTCYALGLYREAIPLQEKVRDYDFTTFGRENTDTLEAMHMLAHSYRAVGRAAETLKILEEVLPLSRKVNGPEHPNTLHYINCLAISYHAAGRLDEALKMREEVLPLSRKVNGPEHFITLSAMSNLASSYRDAGRRDEALKMREELLTLRRKVLGPEHPDALAAMGNLAISYHDAARWDEALKMREEVRALSRKVNGPEHPATLLAMGNLANSYDAAGRKDEALKLREEVLALSRKVNGPEHPATLWAMHYVANSYRDAGRWDGTLKLREEVLALRRKVLGPEHPDALAAMNNLANSYHDAGRWDEALKMREEVRALSRKVNGPEHPATLMAMGNLANSYEAAGRQGEALKLREEVLALSRKVLGPEHPDTLTAMGSLAFSYAAAGRADEAKALRVELAAIKPKKQTPPPADKQNQPALPLQDDF
jgi:tetratricopeptide (TPR) repeat protein